MSEEMRDAFGQGLGGKLSHKWSSVRDMRHATLPNVLRIRGIGRVAVRGKISAVLLRELGDDAPGWACQMQRMGPEWAPDATRANDAPSLAMHAALGERMAQALAPAATTFDTLRPLTVRMLLSVRGIGTQALPQIATALVVRFGHAAPEWALEYYSEPMLDRLGPDATPATGFTLLRNAQDQIAALEERITQVRIAVRGPITPAQTTEQRGRNPGRTEKDEGA